MLFEILLSLVIGTFAGTLTGLIPGIHINLIGAFIVSLSSTSPYPVNPIYLVVFITSMAITHTFLDFIPSVFLGCPDTDTELSILPGHKLLQKGQAYEAILLTGIGGLAATIILIAISFPSIILIPKAYSVIKKALPYLLILASALLILLEKRKLPAMLVFFLTGTLGLCVLNLKSLNQPLLPLLTGLFGGSVLVMSIKNKVKIPKQKITEPKLKSIRPFIGAALAAPICSFLPGLGSGQAAILGSTISKTDDKEFLALLGATNTLVMGFSFISLYTISKTRTGAAAAIKSIIGIPSAKIIGLVIATCALTSLIAFRLTKVLARTFVKKIQNIKYTSLSIATLLILSLIILLISKVSGLFVFLISTITGIYCIEMKVRRTNMMGCLLIPTIIFYLT